MMTHPKTSRPEPDYVTRTTQDYQGFMQWGKKAMIFAIVLSIGLIALIGLR